MGFRGPTYPVPCDRGGLTANENTDLVAPFMMIAPSRNVNLHRNGRGKRGGTAKVNSSAVSGTPRIMGLVDFQLGATSYQVFAGDDGKIYRDSSTVLKTGMSTGNKFSFAVFGQELYIADGTSTPQTWDGSAGSTSDITTPAADWASTPPIQFLTHARNASRRLWAVAGSALYYSSLGNGKEFSGGTSGKISFDTEDSTGLVGAVEFGNRIIAFSRKRAFVVLDEDSSTANWGYEKAQWTGGAAHWRMMIPLENDLLVVAEDGQLYSVTGAQEYGDYRLATLMRPAYIDNYIRDNLSLTMIADWHAVYDRTLRAVKMFVVRSGQSRVDTALVFFLDRGAEEGWIVHDNQSSVSGYSASCSVEVRTGAGTYQVYTGGYVGFLWKLEQSARNDDSAGYYAGIMTPNLTQGDPRLRKHYRQLKAVLKAQGSGDTMNVNVFVDGQLAGSGTLDMAGGGATLGSFILDTDVLGGVEFTTPRLALNYVGARIRFELYNSTVDKDFFISQLLLDFKPVPITT